MIFFYLQRTSSRYINSNFSLTGTRPINLFVLFAHTTCPYQTNRQKLSARRALMPRNFPAILRISRAIKAPSTPMEKVAACTERNLLNRSESVDVKSGAPGAQRDPYLKFTHVDWRLRHRRNAHGACGPKDRDTVALRSGWHWAKLFCHMIRGLFTVHSRLQPRELLITTLLHLLSPNCICLFYYIVICNNKIHVHYFSHSWKEPSHILLTPFIVYFIIIYFIKMSIFILFYRKIYFSVTYLDI